MRYGNSLLTARRLGALFCAALLFFALAAAPAAAQGDGPSEVPRISLGFTGGLLEDIASPLLTSIWLSAGGSFNLLPSIPLSMSLPLGDTFALDAGLRIAGLVRLGADSALVFSPGLNGGFRWMPLGLGESGPILRLLGLVRWSTDNTEYEDKIGVLGIRGEAGWNFPVGPSSDFWVGLSLATLFRNYGFPTPGFALGNWAMDLSLGWTWDL